MLSTTTGVSVHDFSHVMLSTAPRKTVPRDLGRSHKDCYVLAAQVSENHFHWILLLKKVIKASTGSRVRESDSTS